MRSAGSTKNGSKPCSQRSLPATYTTFPTLAS
jgi:hypothetical protein